MSVYTKIHASALKETMELLIIASIIALVADIAWLVHDIHTNGLTLWYSFVGIGLLSGLGLTVAAFYTHHCGNVKTKCSLLLKAKLHTNKKVVKHRKGYNK